MLLEVDVLGPLLVAKDLLSPLDFCSIVLGHGRGSA